MVAKAGVPTAAAAGGLLLAAVAVCLQGCGEQCDPVATAPNAKNQGDSTARPSGKAARAVKIVAGGCDGEPAGQCPSPFPTYKASLETSPSCKLAVVGAGTGGLYAALRLLDTKTIAGPDMCIFEATGRVGGRLLSLRGLGPGGDLSVDAGGYRTWPEYTPVTHALVTEYLNLSVACYENEDPCEKFNIVDADGNKAGFTLFVERMMEKLVAAGARYFPLHRLMALEQGSLRGAKTLKFANGAVATASPAVILNIPQQPLLEVLRESSLPESAVGKAVYAAIHTVQSEIVTKVYLYYKNAWWYDLGLRNGEFELEGDAARMPLKGRYHDGDVRCTNGKCHGFLLATYIHDYSGESAMYFRRFQKDRGAPVTILSSSTVEGKIFLDNAHARLHEYHAYHLPRDSGLAPFEVSSVLEQASPPEFAVLATWNVATEWAGGGWHGWLSLGSTGLAMAPFEDLGIHVINEAYSNLQGWAEGTLQLADTVLKKHFSVDHPWSFTAPNLVQRVAQTRTVPACDDEGSSASVGGNSGGGGGGISDDALCFAGDARLLLANGSIVPLAAARVGMEVSTGQGKGVVTEVLVHRVGREALLARLPTPEGELVAEPSHPILVDGRWLEIAEAHSQGLLQNLTFELLFVEQLYNLEIDGHAPGRSPHAYVVNGLVASGLGDSVELNMRFPRQTGWKAKASKETTAAFI